MFTLNRKTGKFDFQTLSEIDVLEEPCLMMDKFETFEAVRDSAEYQGWRLALDRLNAVVENLVDNGVEPWEAEDTVWTILNKSKVESANWDSLCQLVLLLEPNRYLEVDEDLNVVGCGCNCGCGCSVDEDDSEWAQFEPKFEKPVVKEHWLRPSKLYVDRS